MNSPQRTSFSTILAASLLAVPSVADTPQPGGPVLAFAAQRASALDPDPSVAFAAFEILLAPGDALEYDLDVPVGCAERVGVALVDESGTRIGALAAGTVGAWTHVVEPLDAFSGRKIRSAIVATRNAVVGACAFRLDNVRLRRADSVVTWFENGLSDARWILRDERRGAGLAVAPMEFDAARAWTRLDPRTVVEPWHALDLATRRGLSQQGAIATEAGPTGLVFGGPGVPLRLAEIGQPRSFTSVRQRVGFEPLDGGRYYSIHLATSSAEIGAIPARAFLYGDGGERREIAFTVPPTSGDVAVISLAVAAEFPLRGLDLPDDPRIHVHAITLCWRKDAASDTSFRAAWIARECAGGVDLDEALRPRLSRYVANRSVGPLFVDVPGEEEGERALFQALLTRDRESCERLLDERIEAQAAAGAPLKRLRLSVETADSKALSAPFGPWASTFGAETIVHAITSAELSFEAGPAAGAQIRIGRDLSYLRQAPQLLASAGISTAIGVGAFDLRRWSGGEGSTLLVATALGTLGRDLRRDPESWRSWARRVEDGTAQPEALVLTAFPPDVAQRFVDDLVNADVAPRARRTSTAQFVVEAAKRPGVRVQDMVIESAPPIDAADLEATRAYAETLRRAEAYLLEAQTFGAFARADGLALAPSRLDALGRALAESRTPADVARVEAESRVILVDSLSVLARAAATAGEGTPIVAFQPLPWARRELVLVDDSDAACFDDRGTPLPVQRASGGVSIFEARIPATGYAVVHVRRKSGDDRAVPESVSTDEWTARNENLSIRFDPSTGTPASVRRIPEGIETLAEPARIHAEGVDDGEWRLVSMSWIERGPLRAILRTEHQCAAGDMVLDYVLRSGARRVDVVRGPSASAVRTSLRFPLADPGPKALVSVPFGSAPVARSRRADDRFVLRDWAIAPGAGGGLAIVAGLATTFGYSEGTIAVDVPTSSTADVAFALVPIGVQWRRAGLEHEALELAHAARLVVEGAHPGARAGSHSFVTLARLDGVGRLVEGSNSGLALTALRPALDGEGWIVRLAEMRAEQALVRMRFDRPIFAPKFCDVREIPFADVQLVDDRLEFTLAPQRVQTIRFRLRP